RGHHWSPLDRERCQFVLIRVDCSATFSLFFSVAKKDAADHNRVMNHRLNRRLFLKRAALTAGALSAARFLPGPSLLQAVSPSDKLNCVLIGCGGRGLQAHMPAIVGERVAGIVDVIEKRHGVARKILQDKGQDPEKLQAFTDYRKMFDKIGKEIDAVFIATPNHHHALPAMMAMNLGKAVYCEKPLTHDIAEARKLREKAAQSKVPAQMGNQGHCEEGYHRLCEFVWGG